ncbi:Uncharacterized membrane protein YvlD, DUF360 family [Armatimonadetes bacterium GBS]|nr:Uncharacterized membrane protein YvlD, DUF360 family [Armatimonadetes bacterium GBS]CUU35246.1 Uncharacterized membrane protein YvlD, DUF360 family [Armatimonadetes bacterium GXS]
MRLLLQPTQVGFVLQERLQPLRKALPHLYARVGEHLQHLTAVAVQDSIQKRRKLCVIDRSHTIRSIPVWDAPRGMGLGIILPMRFLLKWVVFAVALHLTFWSGQAFGLDMKPSPYWQDNLIMALLLGLVNALIRPTLRWALFPLNCLTLGLVGLLVNTILFWLVFALAPFNFRVGNFWAALYGSLVLGLINAILSGVLLNDEDRKRR